MTRTIRMLGIALAASTALSTAAVAQDYGSASQRTQQPQPQPRAGAQQQDQKKGQKGGATVTIGDKKVAISAEFAAIYKQLLDAANANDMATVTAKAPQAHAAAKTPEEHFLASQLQLKAGMAT